MAGYQSGQYYDNKGYLKDNDDDYGDGSSVPVEPAPRQFLPRIITGSEIGGQKPTDTSDSPVPMKDGLVGSPQSPRFQVKSDKSSGNPLATISQLVEDDASSAGGDDEENRDTWDNPLEFLLSCISMSVGLGNIWRFPAAAASNGGGAFLIPYLVVLMLIGRPLYYLEMCLGQFSHFGSVKVWNMVPLFKGVGYGSLIGVISVVSYYCYLMALTVRFFVSSFFNPIPWGVCHQDEHPHINCSDPKFQYDFAALYFQHTVNPQLPNIDNGLGKLNWQLLLCLICSWLLICLSLIKGVKSSGKVAYFTAIFPYVVLFILLIRGVTLKGAWKGIREFLEPKWIEITKPKVWYAAVEQCFFSLNIGFGSVIMFSSYNSFRQNVYKDALIISFLDTFTSLLAGCTVFAVIGSLMEARGVGIDEINGVKGAGLAFVLYPEAIASFDWVPQLFAVLFFLMLFTLGIGSASSLTGSIITIICDQFPYFKRWIVTVIVCICGCIAGIMYCTEGGLMMLDLVDHYGSGFVIYVMVIVETSAISYVYGLDNFCNDIQFMLGRHVGIYWRLCWGFIIPVGLFANLMYYLATSGEFKSGDVPYPTIGTIFGWLWTAVALGMIPGWALHTVLTRKEPTLKEKFAVAIKPTRQWGPQGRKLRKEWQDFRQLQDREGPKRRFLIF